MDERGVMETNTRCYDSVGEVFVGEDGKMLKNKWHFLNNTWYYLGADGYAVKDQWMRDSVGWCYVGNDGYCLTDAWKADSSGNLFYLNHNGNMATNQWAYTGNALLLQRERLQAQRRPLY